MRGVSIGVSGPPDGERWRNFSEAGIVGDRTNVNPGVGGGVIEGGGGAGGAGSRGSLGTATWLRTEGDVGVTVTAAVVDGFSTFVSTSTSPEDPHSHAGLR